MNTRHHKVWPKGLPQSLPPLPGSLYDNLRNTAAAHPDVPAILYYGAEISYADLKAQVDALAGFLAMELGVQANDRVLLYLQNSPQLIIAYYAILAANAVIVPVNPMSRTEEIKHIAGDAGATVAIIGTENLNSIAPLMESGIVRSAVCARYADAAPNAPEVALPDVLKTAPAIPRGAQGITAWEDTLGAGHIPPEHTRGPEDWAVIPYSSGTTGKPKGCLHTNASANAVVHAYARWIEMPPGTPILSTLPLFHVTGMQNSMNVPIYAGATIVLMTRWDRETAISLIERHRIVSWRSITASAVDFISAPDLASRDIASLKSIGGGGAQMPEAAALKLKALTGLDFIEAYGLSETIAATHINPTHAPKPQCLGIPLFDVDCRIIDTKTGTEQPPGESGEIVTHAPQVFVGYWNNPEATDAVFMEIDGKKFLRTGDIGYQDEDGYFYYVDRLKRMINASGYKVWPAEVEAMLYDHPAIREACIIGVPDEKRGETVKAVIVAEDGIPTPAPGDLEDWCRQRMASYKVPRLYEFRKDLPRTGMGKILWRALR